MTETGLIAGYASLFNRRDGAGDIVLPGAFARSLKQSGPGAVRMLFQHDPGEPLGRWHDIREDSRGLYVRGSLNLEVRRARDVYALLRQGGLDGLSIGFRTRRASRIRAASSRYLHDIDLWEVSIVTFPMLAGARIKALAAGSVHSNRDQGEM